MENGLIHSSNQSCFIEGEILLSPMISYRSLLFIATQGRWNRGTRGATAPFKCF